MAAQATTTPVKEFSSMAMADTTQVQLEGGGAGASVRGISRDATVEEVKKRIDDAMKAIKTTRRYSCKLISWEDVQRGTTGGGLSCLGSNISDVWLSGKDGQPYYTFRPDNWNEPLCKVRTDRFAVVANIEGSPTTMTLQSYLLNIDCYALPGEGITDAMFDYDEITVRFQYCIVENEAELTPKVYNYQSDSKDRPRNMQVMFNTQSASIGFDEPGGSRAFLHCPNESGGVNDMFIKIDKTEMAAGSEQSETAEESMAAAAAGKACVATFGTPEMGKSCNVIGMLQIPIIQKAEAPRMRSYEAAGAAGAYRSLDGARCIDSPKNESFTGSLSVGRASIGSTFGEYTPPKLETIEQEEGMGPAMTITYYVVYEGGVPDNAKIQMIVDHMEKLNNTVGDSQFDLADAPEGVTVALKKAHVDQIKDTMKKAPHPMIPGKPPTVFEFPAE
jgi:hypothetical protein